MSDHTYDTAVIGAGVFGAWTAWHLGRAGQSVLLMDAWGPGHSRASSGGESRIIRMGYGADEIYTRMSMRSMTLWRELFGETGQQLFHQTGVLWIAHQADRQSGATCSTLAKIGVVHEILPLAEILRRYPQIRIQPHDAYGIYEPHSGALMARRAVAAVADSALRMGVEFVVDAIAPPAPEKIGAAIRTAGGREIRAANYVFACGAWLAKLFPDLLGSRIFPTRQEVFFFAPPPGDPNFSPGNLPVWLDYTDARGPYGFPNLESRGFKLAFDRHGQSIDPDNLDRRITPEGLAEAYRYLAERFPALADAPLTESRVCQYENTSNGDFLIDRHPAIANIWLVGGGSGHGFKHGPAVGEYVCRQILQQGEPEPRFSLATKALHQARTVY
jgi:monomeric sarcosine oxidase